MNKFLALTSVLLLAGATATPVLAQQYDPDYAYGQSHYDDGDSTYADGDDRYRSDAYDDRDAYERLRQRAALLDERRFRILHFTGPGTDLRVGLDPAESPFG